MAISVRTPVGSRSTVLDPMRNFKYQVLVDGFTSAGFSKVSGLKETHDVVEYREGTDPITPRKLMGLVKYEDVSLERGHSANNDFVNWAADVLRIQRSGNMGPDGDPAGDVRRAMVIEMADQPSGNGWRWTYFQCWPKELEATELTGMGNEVNIEKCVVANEGYEKEPITF